MSVNILITWLQHNMWAAIITVIIAAYLASFLGGLIIAPFIRQTIGRLRSDMTKEDAKKRQDTLIGLFHVLLKVIIWLVAFFTVLGIAGINLTAMLAGAGVVGVAIGFGAQSIIKDFLSGLFIIVENQYRVGDVVELNGASGTVEQISIRSTVIRDMDGGVHFIPNGNITQVVNKTLGYSKINLTITVGGETNIDRLATLINEVGAELADEDGWKDKIIQAPKFLSISNFSESALEIKISGKTLPSKQWDVTNELRKRLLGALKKHKIELA